MARRVQSVREEPSRDAAEVVAAIAERLRGDYPDVAHVDLKYIPGYLSDLTVEPRTAGAAAISIVGMGAGFVLHVGEEPSRRWEIENNPEGRAQLEDLISEVLEGRLTLSRWPFGRTGSYLPYR